MKKPTKIVISILMVLGVTSAVFAYSGNGHWRMDPKEKAEFVTERVTKKLSLNDLQVQNLQGLTDTAIELMVEMKKHRSQHFEDVQQLLEEPVLDQAKALQMIQQKTQMINDKAPQVIARLAEFLDSLDSDQKNQLHEFVNKRMNHHRN